MRRSGTLTTWNDEKGFGFIVPDNGSPEVFLHISALRRGQPRPAGGETIYYELGADEKKRPRAMRAKIKGAPKRSSGNVVVLLPIAFLTAISVAAVVRVIPSWIPMIYFGVSLIAFLIYDRDKSKARRGLWRTSEETLHILELLGGWPGALFAQRMFRHKNRKLSFQIVFWLIVAAHLALWGWIIRERPAWLNGRPAEVFPKAASPKMPPPHGEEISCSKQAFPRCFAACLMH